MMDLLAISDLGSDVRSVLDLAHAVKKDRSAHAGALAGTSIGLFFQKPSTRTRVSGEVAAAQLGAHPVVLGQREVGLGTRESTGDVGRVLDRYLDLVALRVFHHADLLELAEVMAAPVVNLLSDIEHPCQALTDLMTIEEVMPLTEARIAYVGDGNNVCHSLMVGAAMTGAAISVVTPEGEGPDDRFVQSCRLLGGAVEVGTDLALVEGANVVYTDVWTSMGQETEAEARLARFAPYQIDDALMDRAADGAVFLHCLPAHRGEEVTDEVIDGAASIAWDQAENRLHVFKAVLLSLLA